MSSDAVRLRDLPKPQRDLVAALLRAQESKPTGQAQPKVHSEREAAR